MRTRNKYSEIIAHLPSYRESIHSTARLEPPRGAAWSFRRGGLLSVRDTDLHALRTEFQLADGYEGP